MPADRIRLVVLAALVALAPPIGGRAEEGEFHARLAVHRPTTQQGLQRLAGEIEAGTGGLYGGMRGGADEVFGDGVEAVVYAGYRREPPGAAVDLSYQYRLGLLGRDPGGHLAIDMDRQLTESMDLAARLHLDSEAGTGGATASARFGISPVTQLSAQVDQPIGRGGIDDLRARLRLDHRFERRFPARDAQLGFELSQADAPPRAVVFFRMPF